MTQLFKIHNIYLFSPNYCKITVKNENNLWKTRAIINITPHNFQNYDTLLNHLSYIIGANVVYTLY